MQAINFSNSYAALPEVFFARQPPVAVASPALIKLNDSLAQSLGLDADFLASENGIAMLSGNVVPDGADPIAMAYAGHQFGNWVPQLGDGRAILLGEVIDKQGIRQDIQLKGAGRTPFSRGGDGRNWLGPVLREYVISEAMAMLGVPTTRSLAAVSTGEFVFREAAMPGAILTRVARSHVRVGTFQYFVARNNIDAIKTLTEHVIARHYPEAAEAENAALALLQNVVIAQAKLVAHWQSIGFIHGVMNTDNCSISGDTIDYGPCAFMDTFEAAKVFSSIDVMKRYAYQNQPRVAQWNVMNLAQCLLDLLHEDKDIGIELAQEAINSFEDHFIAAYTNRMRAKLGLLEESDDDLELITDLLATMESGKLDFTISFRTLATRKDLDTDIFAANGMLGAWHSRWQQRLSLESHDMARAQQLMRSSNPAIIPRNHQVEAMINAAIAGDFSPFETLNKALQNPFDVEHDGSELAAAPLASELVTQTFCGT